MTHPHEGEPMSKKRQSAATDAEVLAFIAAVFPDAPELARLVFDEAHVLTTATELITSLRAKLDASRTEITRLREALEQIAGETDKRLFYENIRIARAALNGEESPSDEW